ncbi:hypothetical protein C6P45_005376 [Maudiozyma exigua]|uniref:Uncharacterized protein n=1 Tax=Maudiozyma exigua TaxID=34358 RepID=A0A9P6WB84_MAUEX|nr:hypothetical protein C6P45_005376 [Kazachstania exigua]
MEESMDDYVKTLETQLENKLVFLKQSRDSLKRLRQEYKTDGEPQEIDPEVWKLFMRKPVMYVEKSDPIGLSLADVNISLQNETSIEWMELMDYHHDTLQQTINTQKNLNKDLTTLITLLEQGDSGNQDMVQSIPVTSSSLRQNERLRNSLRLFTQHVLCENTDDIATVTSMIDRLIRYDPSLSVADFLSSHSTERLYRLLVKASLLETVSVSDNTDSFVKMIDFTDNDLS